MLNAIKKLFGIKPTEPAAEVPYKVEAPLVQPAPETITVVETAPLTVTEPAVTTPTPLVVEPVVEAVPAKKAPAKKAPAKPKVAKVAAIKAPKKPRAPKAV